MHLCEGFLDGLEPRFCLENLLATLEVPENQAEKVKGIFRRSEKDLGPSRGRRDTIFDHILLHFSV